MMFASPAYATSGGDSTNVGGMILTETMKTQSFGLDKAVTCLINQTARWNKSKKYVHLSYSYTSGNTLIPRVRIPVMPSMRFIDKLKLLTLQNATANKYNDHIVHTAHQ